MYEAMLQFYVWLLSVVRLSVVCVLTTFLLRRTIQGMGNVLPNSSILEYSGSTNNGPGHGRSIVDGNNGDDRIYLNKNIV